MVRGTSGNLGIWVRYYVTMCWFSEPGVPRWVDVNSPPRLYTPRAAVVTQLPWIEQWDVSTTPPDPATLTRVGPLYNGDTLKLDLTILNL